MTINEQLETFRAALAGYAQEIGADLGVAADRGDFLRRIENNPTGMSIVLLFTGERMDEAGENALVVWRSFAVVMARPHGWTVIRADNLTADQPGSAPFWDIMERVRNALINVEMDGGRVFAPAYKSAALLDTGAAPMDAWELVFEAGARLSEPGDEMDES